METLLGTFIIGAYMVGLICLADIIRLVRKYVK
jgi:hypothetical protein